MSVNGNELFGGITLYPNPSTGIFNLEINSFESSNVSINIFDILGRIIYEKDVKNVLGFNQVVDLSSVKKGTYLMYVYVGNHKKIKRIIVK